MPAARVGTAGNVVCWLEIPLVSLGPLQGLGHVYDVCSWCWCVWTAGNVVCWLGLVMVMQEQVLSWPC